MLVMIKGIALVELGGTLNFLKAGESGIQQSFERR